MDIKVNKILLATLVLGAFWEISQSYSLNHGISAEHDNRSVVRLRRQTYKSQCTTPIQPAHGKWSYQSDGKKGKTNSLVDANSVIEYSCDSGYKLSTTIEDSLTVTCVSSNEWNVTAWPNCLKLCPNVYNNNPHITWTCNNDGEAVPCYKATDLTTLTYICDPGYELAKGSSKTNTCLYKGWINRTPDCIPSSTTTNMPSTSEKMDLEDLPLIDQHSKKCTAPAQPVNGEWIYLSNGKKGVANSQIDENSVIIFSCDPGYKLSTTVEDSLLVLCLSTGEWNVVVLPICQKLCPSLYNNSFITFSCKTDGYPVPCDKAADNTILTYKCAPYYESPPGRPESRTCYNGSWDYPPDCIPVCGERRVSATPLIVNGTEVTRGHYPWAVALYRNQGTDPSFINICGGSLITTEIVLTAAHCVSRKETGKIYNAKQFRVRAGKYYHMYEDTRDIDTAQYAEVAFIETHNEYKGEIQNFRGDIALLKLTTSLLLSNVVQPVCYHHLPTIEPNTLGVVTGWGYTTSSGEPSETLKELELPYIANAQCLKDIDEDFSNRYFTPDKFCAGFINRSTSVCSGDSGGGLVFRNRHYKKRYFIHGIVSLAHSYRENQQIHCNIQHSALFTRVEPYMEWIQIKVRQWSTPSIFHSIFIG